MNKMLNDRESLVISDQYIVTRRLRGFMSLALIKSSGRKLFIMCNKAWSVQYWGRGGWVG